MKNAKAKTISYIKQNYPILIVMTVALVLNVLAMLDLGYQYNLESDDLSYVNSGITFLETGKITMHGVLSAQIMPGMTFIIALFALIFGTGTKLWLMLKLFWIIMGILCIFILYKIMKLYTNKWIAIIPTLFLLAPDFLWTNNLILTETPSMLTFELLIYFSLKFLKTYNTKDYIYIIVWYIIGLFIRPTIGLYPIFLAICLLIKKYDFKELIKKGLIAGVVLLAVLTPWTYRNYKIFNHFIPLTYGVGNPLLLGTYQGNGYPLDEELDYETNVYDKIPNEMKEILENELSPGHLRKYYSLELDGLIAKYRMHEWWNKDKKTMIKSYLISKPKILLHSSFYWSKVFGIDESVNLLLRKIDLVLFAIACILIIWKRDHLIESFLIILAYGYHIALYSYTFAFSRYAITLFFLRFIVIGLGLDIAYKIIKVRRSNNESTNNNTSI